MKNLDADSLCSCARKEHGSGDLVKEDKELSVLFAWSTFSAQETLRRQIQSLLVCERGFLPRKDYVLGGLIPTLSLSLLFTCSHLHLLIHLHASPSLYVCFSLSSPLGKGRFSLSLCERKRE
jgi:hypothetical protein